MWGVRWFLGMRLKIICCESLSIWWWAWRGVWRSWRCFLTLQNTCRLPAFIFASFRRFFRRNNSTAFLQIAEKKRGKVAHRRFYKRRRVPTNAETRDAENNIIFRHTGVSGNAGMSTILIIDIPAFWWNAGMLLFNINFFVFKNY